MADYSLTGYDSVTEYQRAHDAIRLRVWDVTSGAATQLVANCAMISDADGIMTTSVVTAAELATLDGISTVNPLAIQLALKADLAGPQTHTGVHTFEGDNLHSGDNTFSGQNDFDNFEIAEIAHVSEPAASGTAGYWRMWVCEDRNIHIIDNSGNEEIFIPSGHRSAEAWSATGDALPANLPNNVWAGITGFTENTSTTGYTFTAGVSETAITLAWAGSVATITMASNAGFVDGCVVTFHALSGGAGNAYDMGIITDVDGGGTQITVQFNTAGITHTAGYIVQPDQFSVDQGTAGNYNVGWHVSWTTNFNMHITASLFKYNYGAAVGSMFNQAIKTTAKQYITSGECCNHTGFGISTNMDDGDIIFLAAQGDAIAAKVATPTYGNIRITP